MENLTDYPILVDPKITFDYVHLLFVKEIIGYGPCRSMRNLGLPNSGIHILLPPPNLDLSLIDHLEAPALLSEHSDLFSIGPHDFRFLKSVSHLLDLKDRRSFCS